MTSDIEAAATPGRGLEYLDTVVTGVAGYYYKATAPAVPGEPVQFVREPGNPYDSSAIGVFDRHGQRLGYLPRGVAAEFAGLLDHGCARLCGRLLASGEPDYDPGRAEVNPPLIIVAYADLAGLEEFFRQFG